MVRKALAISLGLWEVSIGMSSTNVFSSKSKPHTSRFGSLLMSVTTNFAFALKQKGVKLTEAELCILPGCLLYQSKEGMGTG